jgi:anaerobic selenocysteine-containing dehydrogenase
MQALNPPRQPRLHPFGAALAGLLLTLGAVNARAAGDPGAVAAQLPDMGSPENAVLSKADEYQIGLMAVRQLRGQDLILEDPELTDYIQHLGSRLAAQARDDDQNFQYFIVRSNEINAFATYGGFICVNAGLVLLTETDGRDAVFVSSDDLTRLRLEAGQRVRLTSADGSFEGRLRQAPIKPGNLEVHWPEGNTLLSGTAIDPDSMEPDYNAVVMLEAI